MMKWKCACGEISELVLRFNGKKSERPIPFIKCDSCKAHYVIVFCPFEGHLEETKRPPLLNLQKHKVEQRKGE